jgi:hypothetical protein
MLDQVTGQSSDLLKVDDSEPMLQVSISERQNTKVKERNLIKNNLAEEKLPTITILQTTGD